MKQKLPIYTIPDKPVLQNVPAEDMAVLPAESKQAITNNFDGLIQYNARLRTIIERHNQYANRVNAENGYKP